MNKQIIAYTTLVILYFNMSTIAVDLVTPFNLLPGDSFRFIFLSDTQTPASHSDISIYNSIVSNDAINYSYYNQPLTWRAIVSTLNTDARDNIGGFNTTVPIFVVTGTKISDNLTENSGGLWSGFLQGYANIRINGTSYLNYTWTGTAYNGVKSNPAGDGTVTYGNPLSTSSSWLNSGSGSNGSSFNLYGVSSVLVVPVPEPTSLTLIMTSLGVFGTYYLRFQRKMRKKLFATK